MPQKPTEKTFGKSMSRGEKNDVIQPEENVLSAESESEHSKNVVRMNKHLCRRKWNPSQWESKLTEPIQN